LDQTLETSVISAFRVSRVAPPGIGL